MDGWRKSGSRFQRDGVVKVKDLFVIFILEGLEGRIRETVEDDLVFILFCIVRRLQIRRMVEL